MKKTHRAALSILLVLTLLTALPLTAMADGYYQENCLGNVDKGAQYGDNYGMINVNEGNIGTNDSVAKSDADTIVPEKTPTVMLNEGTVGTNKGTVEYNGLFGIGNVGTNEGTVENNYNGGNVIYNAEDGEVTNNSGVVGRPVQSDAPETNGHQGNSGTVVTNNIDGVVYNNADGKVGTNYGTVHQEQDGDTEITYYGLQAVDDEENGAQRYLGSHASTEAFDLDEAVTTIERKGYKLISYTPYTYDSNASYHDNHLVPQTSHDPIFVGEDSRERDCYKSYTLSAPTLLKLVWEKVAGVFTPASSSGNGGGEVVELSAKKNYIGLGSVIYINEKGYKVVEIKDDAYVVVSFDALSDEDVKDLDALFDSLFTPEQQALIKNVGQLLDAEDVLTVFGKPGNHPVFEVNKSLVQ